LAEAYGEDCMSRARVFEWHKWFSEDREAWKIMIIYLIFKMVVIIFICRVIYLLGYIT